MKAANRQINTEHIATLASSSPANSHGQRIHTHVLKHGIEGLMIYETTQEGSIYWLVGQKVAENRWNVSLVDPKGTFYCSMGAKTDNDFILILSDIDAHVKATLTVEGLDIVPVTSNNVDYKYKLLSKKVEKKMNKLWPFG